MNQEKTQKSWKITEIEKRPLVEPNLNLNYLEIQFGHQIRRNTFLQFVALYLFVALHLTPADSVYTSVFYSPMEQNSL